MGRSSLTAQDLHKVLGLLNMVQEDFAQALGVRGASVSRWLGGQVPVPGYVEAWLRAAHPDIYREIKDG